MSGIGGEAAAEARRWVGTPYRHQASVRGAGADCLGLLRGVWRALYGHEPELIPAYTPDWGEAGADERLWRALARHMPGKPLEQAAPGDVILFRMRARAVAKHVALQAGVGADASFVHAYSGHGVVESPQSGPWTRRIVARFEFPGRRT
ncbi:MULTISPECIES: NlpC/P60 family protein [Actibacterium]|uniref:NlpC/P60 family putative phage cell wall peptidase n=1 Tax=Actibacterium naphthalenivorans TaxID=1614693 RepID=A0A840C7X7_9RHOB|nr:MULTISPECIES: NlpC/P60 family protein [Actibacterium]ALG90162.1 peptidase [Actibacterium sp. EMB200-NS6]MBB4022051.1 NlpC/P60 family putative phage cell wall peptidase [Actibacterium naphthalenivorans]